MGISSLLLAALPRRSGGGWKGVRNVYTLWEIFRNDEGVISNDVLPGELLEGCR